MSPICPVCGSVMRRGTNRYAVTTNYKTTRSDEILYQCIRKDICATHVDKTGRIHYLKDYINIGGHPEDDFGIQLGLMYI